MGKSPAHFGFRSSSFLRRTWQGSWFYEGMFSGLKSHLCNFKSRFQVTHEILNYWRERFPPGSNRVVLFISQITNALILRCEMLPSTLAARYAELYMLCYISQADLIKLPTTKEKSSLTYVSVLMSVLNKICCGNSIRCVGV